MTDGVSILDAMVKGTMDRKVTTDKGAKLTPVAGEVAPIHVLPTTQAPFPNDVPDEVVAGVVRELTRQIEHLIETRDALAALVGQVPPSQAGPTEAEVKAAAEKAADAKHSPLAALADLIVAEDRSNAEVLAAAVEAPDLPGETFAARFARLKAEASGATFVVPPGNRAGKSTVADSTVDGGEDPGVTPVNVPQGIVDETGQDGWVCPTHGTFKVATSRLGREFRKCPEGDDFERLG